MNSFEIKIACCSKNTFIVKIKQGMFFLFKYQEKSLKQYGNFILVRVGIINEHQNFTLHPPVYLLFDRCEPDSWYIYYSDITCS